MFCFHPLITVIYFVTVTFPLPETSGEIPPEIDARFARHKQP